MPEKEEILRVRNSRKLYLPVYAMVIVLLLAVIFIKFSGKEINNFAFYAVIVFTFAGILFTEIHRLQNLYEINGDAVVHKKGIFVKIIRKISLGAVLVADYKQNPWQMIFDFGDVNIKMFSTDDGTKIRNINNPAHFVEFLSRKKEEKL